MLVLSAALLATALQHGGPADGDAGERPNIVLIVADDLGWNHVGYHGSAIRTPNIDRLAREGAELDRFYVAPFCYPTRAGLLTGRYPIRYGLMRNAIPPWRQGGLDLHEVTLADVLADAGYERRALLGKWHLGHSSVDYHPLRRGFSEFVGCFNDFVDYFTHIRDGELDWHRNYESNHDEGYTTDLVADAAIDFIERSAKRESPFFCYVAFNAPHIPLQAKSEDLKTYGRRRGDNQVIAAMISNMDQGIGKILEALSEAGIEDDTLVWFVSDNGGKRDHYNLPLRGRKGTVFEGGIRVPASVRWPRRIPEGRKVTAPLAYIDVLPTIMQILGVTDHGGEELDGTAALDLLTGETEALDRDVYAFAAHETPGSDYEERLALVEPEWKLIVTGPGIAEANAPGHELLFRITEDPFERTDLAPQEPETVARMLQKLQRFRALQADNPHPLYNEDMPPDFRPPKEWKVSGK